MNQVSPKSILGRGDRYAYACMIEYIYIHAYIYDRIRYAHSTIYLAAGRRRASKVKSCSSSSASSYSSRDGVNQSLIKRLINDALICLYGFASLSKTKMLGFLCYDLHAQLS